MQSNYISYALFERFVKRYSHSAVTQKAKHTLTIQPSNHTSIYPIEMRTYVHIKPYSQTVIAVLYETAKKRKP